MGFSCGIVGLPNVGKSTLFNALTQASVPAANYPFCTIDPSTGIVPVPDARLDALAVIVKPKRIVPTTMTFVDIAGLVAGASKGEGLGNQFLANIRETDAIAHVVRCFENDDVIHVNGNVDPLRDIAIINTELLLSDLEAVERALQKAERAAKTGNKEEIAKKQLLEGLKAHLDKGLPAKTFAVDIPDLVLFVKQMQLITMKPVLYVANVLEDGFENNPYLDQVKALAKQENSVVVPVCALIESELVSLSEEERKSFLHELGWDESGLDRVIKAGYPLLGLETYFTAGVQEVRAWTIPVGATAPQAAGVIHSDFEKGFIRAEVIAYNDFIQYKGEAGAKDAGKWRLEGKTYIVQDGDVVHFRFTD